MTMSDMTRQAIDNMMAVYAERDRLTKQREDLRGALAELLDYVRPLPGNYSVIDRARNALANLNKTDGE